MGYAKLLRQTSCRQGQAPQARQQEASCTFNIGAAPHGTAKGLGVFGATYDATDHTRFRLSTIVGGGLPVRG